MSIRAPRYGERSLAQVLPSAAAALGVPGFSDVLDLGRASQAVVVVVDGLGHEQLLDASADAPHLAEALQAPLDAAFPTTTPAGIGTIALGMPPGRHGLVGAAFELPDFGVVLNPLHWDVEPPPLAVQPEPNVFAAMREVEVRSHGPARFANSGMTRTLLGNAIPCGYERFDPDLIDHRTRRLDYVYLPELDKVGHGEGAHTANWRACLRDIDRLVARIAQGLPESAVVVVTSDHGMVTIPDAHRLDVDDAFLQAGVRRMAGEPRMRHLYTARPEEVQARWQAWLEDRGTVLTRPEAFSAGLFGDVDEVLAERVGDVIAIAAGDWAFCSSVVDPKPSGLRGMHGALTAAELLVPWCVLRGAA